MYIGSRRWTEPPGFDVCHYLFPDELEYKDELGKEVPKGWSVNILPDLVLKPTPPVVARDAEHSGKGSYLGGRDVI